MPRTFVKDRREGKVAEHFVADKLRAKGWKVTVVSYGLHPVYDLIAVKDRQLFYGEVQWDKRSSDTGRFAIEPLKLRNSQAGYFFIVMGAVVPEDVWFWPKAQVQQLIFPLINNPTTHQGWFGNPRTYQLHIPKQFLLSKVVTKRL